jgi:hypothetical protein
MARGEGKGNWDEKEKKNRAGEVLATLEST